MCGIVGIISFNENISSDILHNSTNSLKHRGPDDEGYVIFNKEQKKIFLYGEDSQVKNGFDINKIRIEGKILFGHRRLSILDTSSAGHQPMQYKDGKYWIIFNGEIYNYIELRNHLKSKGYFFKTNTDTEVIIAAYDYWGENAVKHFNGDWAFAIYDIIKDKIFLSVDRVGVKFLYYTFINNIFIFASEIKAILATNFVKKIPDHSLLSVYLFTWIHDHSEKTMYKGIYKLFPSHSMIIDLKTKKRIIKKYWDCNVNISKEKFKFSKAKKYASEIYSLLEDSIRLRLRADVPIGTCLSGGIDSSAVVMIINKLLKSKCIPSIGEKQKTFTSAYKDEKYIDESFWANKIIKRSGAESYFIYPKVDEFKNDIDDLIYTQDEPFSSTSIYAQYRVMKKASEKVKVVLDGQGADELFGGYMFYYPHYLREGNYCDLIKRYKLYGLKKTIKDIFPIFYYSLPDNTINNKSIYSIIYRNIEKNINFDIDWKEINKVASQRFKKGLNIILSNDEFYFNLPSLLRYEDLNSMRWSIEARVPFTDYRLIEYMMRIPSIYKIHNGWNKWILRLSLKKILPKEILWRKDKLGFPTPEKEWMKILGLYKSKNYKSFFWRALNIKNSFI